MGLAGWAWFIVGVIVFVATVWAVALARRRRDRSTAQDAAQALRMRFARGEITEAEYEQARRLVGP
jgi:uncharacterized membrane protein